MTLTLPPEGTYSDVELEWIENEPPGLFSSDQTSVWGQARKVFADFLQQNFRDQLSRWYLNLAPETCDENDIANWERMLGIPVDTTKTIEARRSFVIARRQRGPFTRTRRRLVVESFIAVTFGVAPRFTTEGIPLTVDGVPLYSDVTDLRGTYAIVEDIPGFSYDVRILDTISVDENGLTRELERITPAPITFTITPVTSSSLVLTWAALTVP